MEIPSPGEAFFSQDLIPHSDTVSCVCSSLVGKELRHMGTLSQQSKAHKVMSYDVTEPRLKSHCNKNKVSLWWSRPSK